MDEAVKHPIPSELKKPYFGCRASVKLKARRRRYKPFVPLILMGNVTPLANKGDELESLLKTQRSYHECSLMRFMETWQNNNIPDSCVDLPSVTTVRADGDARASGKNKLGGLVCL